MLVTGATGILRPAVDALLEHGDRVYALARGAATLASRERLVPVPVDYSDLESMRGAIRRLPRLDAALVYAPTADAEVRPLLRDAVTGPVVELFTSRWAAPRPDEETPTEPEELPSIGIAVLLGWTYGAGGLPEWHSAEAISSAALEALESGRPAVLGCVRPWTDRPG